jgi:FkbM family methyltransferase
MKSLHIRTADRITHAVPPRLDSITTYVLLEQETWFEKELNFLRHWLKPGMTAIDVGANLGVYALRMARWIGPEGRVFAYEPGSEARALLEESRGINGAANLEILALALSDREREGRLLWGGSSELNALGDGGKGEAVTITSLDIENDKRGWRPPDFIKIDAEGEEERILSGGQEFFARHSPLVMFEIKAGATLNEKLLTAFPAMGYRLFKLIAGAPILVPLDPRVPLDPFELNLFAAKPDRINALGDAGFLVDESSGWQPDAAAVRHGLSVLREQSFAGMFGRLLDDAGTIDRDYSNALAAIAVWRSDDLPARVRCGALYFAYRTLAALCNRAPTTARYSTFARLAWEGGWRRECVVALEQMATYIQRVPFQPVEPCWPPGARFDKISAGNDPARWFATAVAEQLERARSYSTFFAGASSSLTWLCEQPNASPEMHRRRVLLVAKAGGIPIVPACLHNEEIDNLNADVWRSGRVPGSGLA